MALRGFSVRTTFVADDELKLQPVLLNHFHSDDSSGGHGSGHLCTKKKAYPASLEIHQMEGTEEGTNLSHTAFKSVQINLAFLAPTYNLYSVLDEQLVGNGKSVSSMTVEKPSKALSRDAQHI